MTWKKETGPDGLPEWSGADSILNAGRGLLGAAAGLVVPALLVLAFGLGSVVYGRGLSDLGEGLPYIVAGLLMLYPAFRLFRAPEWIAPTWKLTASPDGFAYSGAESWAVRFSEVARVETAATLEWEKLRDYSGQVGLGPVGRAMPIPDSEYQAFLFMADGSRRVIYTANADREGVGRLAHSIRAWLDGERPRSAPIAAPIAPFDRGCDGRLLPPSDEFTL